MISRRFDEFRASWLDFKLGFRMLLKYPGLTLVGGLALAFAVWLGAATFELVTQMTRPTLPLPEGERIVGLLSWDAAASSVERRTSREFLQWRTELRSIRDLGAFRGVGRNLVTGDGSGEPVTVAEISASAFRLTRIPPLLGRTLVDSDEQPGAPPVLVIGYDAWHTRFGGDPGVIGQTVRIGGTPTTVVGVMPEGFAFPVNHSFWTPLRPNMLEYGPRQGPGLELFGRLTPGVSLTEAQAELTAFGKRAAADFPGTHTHLRPRVLPYARSVVDPSDDETLPMMSLNLPVVMLVILVCANVALLMFARAATRETEILVRTALGASRGRIIMQLFAEALVLGGVAAVVGLSAAVFGLRWVMGIIALDFRGGRLPFWLDASLSPTTLLYAAVLTLFGAVIAGVVPALKVTRGMGTRLRQVGAGGSGLGFGGVWTAVIVSQVAITVAFPAIAFVAGREGVALRSMKVGFPTEEYLSARLEIDREPAGAKRPDTTRAGYVARFGKTSEELKRRLMADPAVAGVTFADLLPRMDHPQSWITVDDGGAAATPAFGLGHQVSEVSVERDFFDVLGAPVLQGRGFGSGDLQPDARVVIVNRSFVERVLGGRNPIGRRIRDVTAAEWKAGQLSDDDAGSWYEIVGVVGDLGMFAIGEPRVAGIYHVAPAGGLSPARVAVHVRGDPASFMPRLRLLAAEVDPTLRLYEVQPLDRVSDTALRGIAFGFRVLLLVSAIALTLSLAGIYAVMSFTVARRTREIGIRVALGASPRRVATAIFRQPLKHVGLGVAAGAALVGGLVVVTSAGAVSASQLVSVVAYGALMLGVSLLACVVPTRRALRVEPTEALRADA